MYRMQSEAYGKLPDILILSYRILECRASVPRIVLGVHAAFHVLYMFLATFYREWALQQNISRVQVCRSTALS